jgi:hypothetical protein
MPLFRKFVGIFKAAGVALRKRLLGGLPPVFVEDVFSTYLYTGNAGTQTVTNGIDLSTKGGMVWTKSRSGAFAHSIMDTVRGFNYSGTQTRRLDPSTTDNEADSAGNATQATPLSDGFSITTSGGGAINFYNASGATYASWTFRKQPKFFDVVTYTGNGGANRAISHSLGSTPGCFIVKRTDTGGTWAVWHRSLGDDYYLALESTQQAYPSSILVRSATSTTFSVGSDATVNASGGTYVCYLFAHDAGGFGLTGTDNVISCGTFTTDGSGAASVTLGYEPQWVMQKRTDSSTGGNWYIADNMRGMNVFGSRGLFPNLTDAEETTDQGPVRTNATGFTASRFANATYMYVAIRRGPMKTPTVGTSVYLPYTASKVSGGVLVDTGFDVDFILDADRAGAGFNHGTATRLTGNDKYFGTSQTSAEGTANVADFRFSRKAKTTDYFDGASGTAIGHFFRRAPGFFDVVCYTGTGGSLTLTHNLGVVPELAICKSRSNVDNWEAAVVDPNNTSQFFVGTNADRFGFNLTNGYGASPFITSDYLTATTFKAGTWWDKGVSTRTYVAYLFATCPGVSKVGSYTGTATTKQIECGFTAGARFVLIKRTDATSDWYVWDTARGIIAGNDPYLLLNSSAAEVTNTDYIDPYSPGFELSSTAPAALNASGGTYIFLAIA